MNGYHTARIALGQQRVLRPRLRPGGSFTTLLERAARRRQEQA